MAAGGIAAGEIFGRAALDQVLPGEIAGDGTQILSIACNNNCGGRCHLKAHIKDGKVIRISTDETPDSESLPQLRACLKGRAARNRLYHPDRLKHPMKRVGRRGEANFQRISWDEAVETIASNLRRTLDRHGPTSVEAALMS